MRPRFRNQPMDAQASANGDPQPAWVVQWILADGNGPPRCEEAGDGKREGPGAPGV